MTTTAETQREPRAAIIAAARRLIDQKGESFTTQELIKEAGVALQTFYRQFEGKDQLILAVITEVIAEGCAAFAEQAREVDDPVSRLELFVKLSVGAFSVPASSLGPGFVAAEHLRLHQLFPNEIAAATQPFVDLIRPDLQEATEKGLLASADPETDAWLITHLVMTVFHHYAFLPDDPRAATIPDDVSRFCLNAVGGNVETARRTPRRRRRR
ncbi:MAG: TetR/AcrR family transcriptional regulator [Acidimicrobiia bacterium]|nr:TetR/AcrR family transcriptional regulator [Acidimicrobiia bacterium]